jgi:mycofactocin precursor
MLSSDFHFGIQCYKLKPIVVRPWPAHHREVPMSTTTDSPVANATDVGPPATDVVDRGTALTDPTPLVEEELLVEDVSIDGMCGVY